MESSSLLRRLRTLVDLWLAVKEQKLQTQQRLYQHMKDSVPYADPEGLAAMARSLSSVNTKKVVYEHRARGEHKGHYDKD